jgi:hypothetical protein
VPGAERAFDGSEDGDLIAKEATSAGAAETGAHALAIKHAGAVAFSRTIDPTIGLPRHPVAMRLAAQPSPEKPN